MSLDPSADVRAAMSKAFDVSTSFHSSVRAFRNRLLILKAIIIPVAAAVVAIQALIPRAQIISDPMSGTTPARWVLILLVMLFGMIGALVTSIPAMSKINQVESPYNFPLQQGLVKVFVGALTAVVGIVAVDNVGTTGFRSLQTMLGAAVAFGAGQQGITTFLDKRAQQIIDKMPTT